MMTKQTLDALFDKMIAVIRREVERMADSGPLSDTDAKYINEFARTLCAISKECREGVGKKNWAYVSHDEVLAMISKELGCSVEQLKNFQQHSRA